MVRATPPKAARPVTVRKVRKTGSWIEVAAAIPNSGQVISRMATKPRGISGTAEAQIESWSPR